MELKYYLDKAIDEYLSKTGTITTKKIMNYVYSEYNLDANIEEISNVLKMRKSILEIVDGIFVDKDLFISFVKEIDTKLLKSQIEFQYLISISEKQIEKILYVIEDILAKEITIKENYEVDQEKDHSKWTYSKIIDFGMKNGYIKSLWVRNIDYTLEKNVSDYFEAIEEIEETGIQIKF